MWLTTAEVEVFGGGYHLGMHLNGEVKETQPSVSEYGDPRLESTYKIFVSLLFLICFFTKFLQKDFMINQEV